MFWGWGKRFMNINRMQDDGGNGGGGDDVGITLIYLKSSRK